MICAVNETLFGVTYTKYNQIILNIFIVAKIFEFQHFSA